MKYYATPVWLDCSAPGCGAGLAVDSRHLDNINASGGWLCDEHASQEVPC